MDEPSMSVQPSKQDHTSVVHEVEAIQRAAANPEASVWVAASAGTGKTKVLTDRMLHLLVKGVTPERILCLTFTKAAAAEMSNRLLEKLSTWSRLSTQELGDTLKSLMGKTPHPDVMARARALYTEVLDLPRGMRIQTIHAFCQSILSKFPLEAGLNPRFKLLDDRETKALKDEVFESLLEDGDASILQPLSLVLKVVSVGKFKERLEECLDVYDRISASPFRPRSSEQDPLDQFFVEQESRLDLLKQVATYLSEGAASDHARGQEMLGWLKKSVEERKRMFESYKLLFLTTTDEPRVKIMTKKLADQNPFFLEVMHREMMLVHQVVADQVRAKIETFTEAMITLTVKFAEKYKSLKASKARLDYDDLILKAQDLLMKPGIAPWILYKLDQQIDHILIDEAQDTNPHQWGIIKAIVDDLCAGQGREDQDRSLFIVGDAKQSIYSFQKADPLVFDQIRDHFSTGLSVGGRWQELDLDTSFRSSAPVLWVVDQTFQELNNLLPPTVGNKPISHTVFRSSAVGGVELWPLATAVNKDEIAPWSLPLERLYSLEPRTQVVRTVAQKIHHWISNRVCLTSAGNPVEPKDFLILVRKRGRFMEEVVTALKQLNVPVAGVDRMVLNHQLVIRDLIALGRVITNPDNDLNLACVLKGPYVQATEENLFDYTHKRKGTLREVLTGHALEKISSLETLAVGKGPYTFYQTLLEVHGFRSTLLHHLGEEVDETIDEFINQVQTFERQNVPSMAEFLNWFQTDDLELKRDLQESGRNEVRVMTVHGSKGLQAPIVIIPDAFQTPKSLPSVLFGKDGSPIILPATTHLPEDIETLREQAKGARDLEYARLLYVAMTRAEDRLYVGGWETKKQTDAPSWYEMIQGAMKGLPETTRFSFDQEGGWSGEGLRFENARAVETSAITTHLQGSKVDLPEWVRRYVDGSTSIPWRAPSALSPHDPNPLSVERGTMKTQAFAAKDRGSAVHGLLERLPLIHRDLRVEAVKVYLEALNVPQIVGDEIVGEVMAVLDHPELSTLLESGIAEVPVTSLQGESGYLSGRIDRLIVTSETVLIVDYKTDQVIPQRVQDVPDSYKQQLEVYRQMMGKIYPHHKIQCALLWTRGPKLMYIEANSL